MFILLFALFVAAALGFVAGKFLAFLVLVILTLASILICRFSDENMSVSDGSYAITCFSAIAFNLTMWSMYLAMLVAYYLTTHQSGLVDFIRTYILR